LVTQTLICVAAHHLLPAITYSVGALVTVARMEDGGLELRMRCTPDTLQRLRTAIRAGALVVDPSGDRPTFEDLARSVENERRRLIQRAEDRSHHRRSSDQPATPRLVG
jgi:hypothetical protein